MRRGLGLGNFGREGRQRRGGVRWWALALFAGYFVYFYLSNQETVPLTGRTQLVDMSREDEAALGLQSYRQILSQETLVRTGNAAKAVQEIGAKLARAAANEDPGFEWEFNLVQSDQANAFCLPGGKVAVYTGILPVLENSDALAVVMGHEIAHAIARHGAERMTQQKLVQFGSIAAGVAVGEMSREQQQMVMAAIGVGSQFGVLLPFSRSHESEADYVGLIYAARACFDPREAPKVWQRMGAKSGGKSPPEFMSSHPSNQTRIEQLQAWMPEALQARSDAGCPALN